MGQLFQANLAEVGIKVELIPQDINTWIDDAQNHYNFQLALTGVIPGPDPDTILTSLYDVNQANGKMTAYSNPTLTGLIQQGRATVNQAERKNIYAEAQQIIMTDLPAWAINERPILFGTTPGSPGLRARHSTAFAFSQRLAQAGMTYSLLFRGAQVVDGTGTPAFKADVGVEGETIAAIGDLASADATRVVDASGRVVCPGFIDVHSHSDLPLLTAPRSEPKVRQGITTELLGADGLSYAPLTPELLADVKFYLAGLYGKSGRRDRQRIRRRI